MFYVFLAGLSKATLRCYTSISDGIIIHECGFQEKIPIAVKREKIDIFVKPCTQLPKIT